MWNYLIRRIIQIIPVLLIISFVVFVLVFVAGDPIALLLPEDATAEEVASLRAALGLDKPFLVQYFIYVKNLVTLDFGNSLVYGQAALPIVLEKLPATLELALAAMVVAIVIAVPLGIWSATRKDTFLDILTSGGSVLGKAMPNFWLGIMLILIFSVNLQWFPVSGRGSFSHLILPAITLGVSSAAEMARLIRSTMLEVLNQDYVRTARSKGLKDSIVVYKHAFRNTLIPVVTITTLQISHLVGGALVTETVFAWPGLGQLIVKAINTRDMAIVQAAVFVSAFLVIFVNLATDIFYRFIDPRIKYN